MQTVTVQTTQNIGIDYEVAGLGERIVARIIDFAVFFILIFVGLIVLTSSGASENLLLGFIIPVGIAFGIYDLACEMIFNGQSLGKRIMKIRVISLDGGRPAFGQFLLRWLFRMVDFGITFNLGALICAAVTPNVQRIGDMVAGTTLIKTTPRTQLDSLVFKPSADDYQPVFKEAAQLNDSDIELINEVINNYYKTGNAVVVYNMAERLKKHLGLINIPEKMDDMLLLHTVIKDYSHVTAHAEAL